jgi:glycosidase
MAWLQEANVATVPAWAKGGLVYQIFPERFANGNPALSPAKTLPWYDESVSWRDFLGGDLPGIIQKLDYIASLGTTILYLTPIFLSDSSHKYNTFDYFTIDPHFGTKDDLINLVDCAHKRGIRVVLDAVFNHVGVEFHGFQDLVAKGETSSYADWFDIWKYPVEVKDFPDYASYGYYGYMPKVTSSNQQVRQYFCEVGRYWIREADIDGWRIDVAPELDHDFWREFRRAVKAEKDDSLIIGEIWHDCSSWLQGDQYDSTMNYPFGAAIAEVVCGLPEGEKSTVGYYAVTVANLLVKYRKPYNDALWNLIDSHDVSRFLTVAGGDKAKLRMASFLQYTHPGVPLLYYGDELAMEGQGDNCRRGMLWEPERQDPGLLAWYRRLGAIRKTEPVLATGDWRLVSADDCTGLYVALRIPSVQEKCEKLPRTLVIVANMGTETLSWTPNLGEFACSGFFDLLTDQRWPGWEAAAHSPRLDLEPLATLLLVATSTPET